MFTRLQSLLVLALTLPLAYAQSSDSLALCEPSYSWANNALGQSPCDLVTLLQRAPDCLNVPDFVMHALTNSSYVYSLSPPVTPCICTGVIYTLTSACGDCQYTGAYVDWATWMAPCTIPPVNGYPYAVPQDTVIPPWALEVNFTNGNYDPLLAQNYARLGAPSTAGSSTSSSATSSSTAVLSTSSSATSSNSTAVSSTSSSTTSSSVSTSSTRSAATSPPASPAASSSPAIPLPPPASSTPVAAIVGGVIGGVIVLGALAALLFWRRRRHASPRDRAVIDVHEGKGEPPALPAPHSALYMAPLERDIRATSPVSTRSRGMSWGPVSPAHPTSYAGSQTSPVSPYSDETSTLLAPGQTTTKSPAAIRAESYVPSESEPGAVLPAGSSTGSDATKQAPREREPGIPPPAYVPLVAGSSTGQNEERYV